MMKKPALRIFVGLVAVLTLAAYSYTKFTGTTNHPEGYHFFHSIHLDDDAIIENKNKVVQPLMLSKDHDYDFVLKSVNAPVKVVIKDDHGKVMATNYNSETNQYYKSLIFECHISEFYTIEVISQEEEHGECVVYRKSHLE